MNNNEPIKNEENLTEEAPAKTVRRLIVETDGNSIRIVENGLAGALELKALLTELITRLRQ